jgi:peroxiredoxin
VTDVYSLPPDLPAPEDDGAADHLTGTTVPRLELPTTDGHGVDLAEAAQRLLVVYVYPRTGRPGEELPAGWDDIPGARGCTPQSCSFRDHHAEIAAHGARVLGLSAQTTADQLELVERLGLPYPLASDPLLTVADALGLPTFEAPEGLGRLYKRLTFVADGGRVEKVFYPVFPPDRNAAEVVTWLTRRR